jgi:hypothetical protein
MFLLFSDPLRCGFNPDLVRSKKQAVSRARWQAGVQHDFLGNDSRAVSKYCAS